MVLVPYCLVVDRVGTGVYSDRYVRRILTVIQLVLHRTIAAASCLNQLLRLSGVCQCITCRRNIYGRPFCCEDDIVFLYGRSIRVIPYPLYDNGNCSRILGIDTNVAVPLERYCVIKTYSQPCVT